MRKFVRLSAFIGAGAVAVACATSVTLSDGDAAPGAIADGESPRDASLGRDVEAVPLADGGPSESAVADTNMCTETDAGCATGSPGACSSGVVRCDGGASVCAPRVTSQACYSGTPSTRGVGVCVPGTQTCVGSLGACAGEVLPALYENCFNTLDDDCDGVVNNGCPDRLTLGAADPRPTHGGAGGGPTSAFCPPGAFVTRALFYFDHRTSHASGVGLFCAAPNLVQGASSYSVSLTQVLPAPYVTVTGSNAAAADGNYDCGITGLVAATWFVGRADGFVEGLGMWCGNGTATLATNNQLTFSFTNTGSGSFTTYPPGTDFTDYCPANEVLIGFNLRTGSYLDQIQAVCAPLLTVYK